MDFFLNSEQVYQKYKEEGFPFLLKVFNEPNYLEDLTGLTELQAETLDAEVIIVQFLCLTLALVSHFSN